MDLLQVVQQHHWLQIWSNDSHPRHHYQIRESKLLYSLLGNYWVEQEYLPCIICFSCSVFNTCLNLCSFYPSLWWGMSLWVSWFRKAPSAESFIFFFALSLSSKETFVTLDIIGQWFLKNIGVNIFDYHTTVSFGKCKFHVTMLQYSTIKPNR